MISKQRAWDLYDKEMLEVHGINFDAKGIWTEKCVDDEDNGNFIFFDDVILMRSTGLKDVKDNEIFEKDIVKNKHTGKIGVVTWCVHNAGFFISRKKENQNIFESLSLYNSKNNYEIIGNVYENRELYKKIMEN